MKRLSRMLGVTLLEIMLVLAIAAMVIVMSIKYYQSATNSQQANTLLNQILAITAAADNLSQGTGTFTPASQASVSAVVGASNMTLPWTGSAITVTPAASTFDISVVGVPTAVCTAVAAKINTGKGSRFTSSTCSGTTLKVDYSMTPN